MNGGSKVALFWNTQGAAPWGSQGFRRSLSLGSGQAAEGRLKVQRWRVGDPDKGLGTGLPEGSALPGRGPSSQTTDCARSLAPTPEFSVEPARAAPSHPPGTARHLPVLLGSRAPGPATSVAPAPAAAPAPPARRCLETAANTAPLARGRGLGGTGDSRLGMLGSSHSDFAEEEERRGESPASVMLQG